jgi:hypothetical protein
MLNARLPESLKTPSTTLIEDVPPLVCDDEVVTTLTTEFKDHFGKSHTETMSLDTAADDFECRTLIGILEVRIIRSGKMLMMKAA